MPRSPAKPSLADLPEIEEIRVAGEQLARDNDKAYAYLVERLRPELDRLLETEKWRWLVEKWRWLVER